MASEDTPEQLGFLWVVLVEDHVLLRIRANHHNEINIILPNQVHVVDLGVLLFIPHLLLNLLLFLFLCVFRISLLLSLFMSISMSVLVLVCTFSLLLFILFALEFRIDVLALVIKQEELALVFFG